MCLNRQPALETPDASAAFTNSASFTFIVNIRAEKTGPVQPTRIRTNAIDQKFVPIIKANRNIHRSPGTEEKISIILITMVSTFLPTWNPTKIPSETPMTVSTIATRKASFSDQPAPVHSLVQTSLPIESVPKIVETARGFS